IPRTPRSSFPGAIRPAPTRTSNASPRMAARPAIGEALFEPWGYRDEKLTMRWDPLDDRRYALMDRDPTASDNKSTTVWMANLLAYRALAFFPCAPGGRGLDAAGWNGDAELHQFTWPLWERPLSRDTI